MRDELIGTNLGDILVRSESGVQAQRMGELIDNLIELSRVSLAEVTRQRLDFSRIAGQIFEQLRANEPILLGT